MHESLLQWQLLIQVCQLLQRMVYYRSISFLFSNYPIPRRKLLWLFTPVWQELFILVDSTPKPVRQAKMFTVFWHPIERHTSEFQYLQSASHEGSYRQFLSNRTIDQWAQSHYVGENWMTRMLVNKHMGGRLNDDDLILTKNILQSNFLVSLTSQMAESMRRIQQHFQWVLPAFLPNYRSPQSGQDCDE
jgi:hypothetical protein